MNIRYTRFYLKVMGNERTLAIDEIEFDSIIKQLKEDNENYVVHTKDKGHTKVLEVQAE